MWILKDKTTKIGGYFKGYLSRPEPIVTSFNPADAMKFDKKESAKIAAFNLNRGPIKKWVVKPYNDEKTG